MALVVATGLEALNNELLLEMMEYLDGYNLFLAFDGLNRRFNDLIRSSYLHVTFDESKIDRSIWEHLSPSISGSQLRSLSFNQSNPSVIHQYLPTIGPNLRSMILQNIDKPLLQFIMDHIPKTNQMKFLSIKNCWYKIAPEDRNIEDFIFNQHGHRLLSLTYCSLVLMPYTSRFPSVTNVFEHLRCLSLNDSRWTSNTVLFLLNSTPNLRKLRLRPSGDYSEALLPLKTDLSHIQKLEILLNNDTSDLPFLLSKFPALDSLRVVYYEFISCPTLNGKAWERVIEDQLPNLRRMTLDFFEEEENRIDEQFVQTFREGKFWSKRQISTKTEMNEEISPNPMVKRLYFGKPWSFGTDI